VTTEDRRLVAALTTEVREQRAALEALVKDIEYWFDIFSKNPSYMESYVEAKRLLK
jgi:hypothetical protein